MLRSIFAGLFAIVLTLGLGISSVSAKTVEVKLGTDAGMLAFEPSTVTISAGDTVKFVNNKLAPHNAVFDGHEELSHADLAFAPGESWEETFETADLVCKSVLDYYDKCYEYEKVGKTNIKILDLTDKKYDESILELVNNVL